MSKLDLQDIRGKLDETDRQIVELFKERMRLCEDVARYKIGRNKPVYDRKREEEKLAAVRDMVEDEFGKQAATELFTQLMAISRRFQYGILAENGMESATGYRAVDSLPMDHARVVYQGVEGAYSHEAALCFFGEDASVYHVPMFEDAMKDVEEGRADYAVLPIENSSAGAVSDNYDLLIRYHNSIAAEIFLPVNHALLGLPDASLTGIKTVFSHPQALMQCSRFLNENRGWRQVSLENTAAAAKKVLEEGDKSQAAVASEAAGRLYGLKVLKKAINYNRENTTRFIILSREPIYQKDAGKISICFELPHKSGSLYNMLGNFIYNQVNMRMIESRPIEEKNWEYRFFVDIEGNLSDASIQNALKGIEEEALNMRILGNY